MREEAKRVFHGVMGFLRLEPKVSKSPQEVVAEPKSEGELREILSPPKEDPQKIIPLEEIEKILPHRGRMRLLDRVVISLQKVTGEFLVTQEVCEGHGIAAGETILRGSDLYDMAAQLLGVWAGQYADLKGKPAFVRRYGEAKFQGPIFPGDLVLIETRENNLRAEISIVRRAEIITITGTDFSVRVKNQQRAIISLIELASFSRTPQA